jgi:hypothetical protein
MTCARRLGAQTGIGGQPQIPADRDRGASRTRVHPRRNVWLNAVVQRRHFSPVFNRQHSRIRQQDAVQIGAQMHRIGPQPPMPRSANLAAVGQPGERRDRQIGVIGNRDAEELQQDFIGVPAQLGRGAGRDCVLGLSASQQPFQRGRFGFSIAQIRLDCSATVPAGRESPDAACLP